MRNNRDIYFKNYRIKHKKEISEYVKEYRLTHREQHNWTARAFYARHRDKLMAKARLRSKDPLVRIKTNKRLRERRNANKFFKIENNFAGRIRKCLKGNKRGYKWESIVGYNLDELKSHLELKFSKEMNWENYGSYWHIDHIIPKSWFHYESFEEVAFKNCWSLKNLQPLEASINIKKHNCYVG